MSYQDIEQGSDAWRKIRLGKVTASRVHDVTARIKSGWAASRANYAAALIAERLTGTVHATYTNGAMEWGTDTEPQARAAYEFHTDTDVEQIAFVDHPSICMSGCSPDGLIGSDGLLEIKCPNTATHIATLLSAVPDKKYVLQVQWQMACTGRKWADLASFDPRLPPEMQLSVTRVDRDTDCIRELEIEVLKFLCELEVTLERLRQRYQLRAQLEASVALARTEAA